MSSSHATFCCLPDNARGAERNENRQEWKDAEEDSDRWRRGWPSFISKATFYNRWAVQFKERRPSWQSSGSWQRRFEEAGGVLALFGLEAFLHYHDWDSLWISHLCHLQLLKNRKYIYRHLFNEYFIHYWEGYYCFIFLSSYNNYMTLKHFWIPLLDFHYSSSPRNKWIVYRVSEENCALEIIAACFILHCDALTHVMQIDLYP